MTQTTGILGMQVRPAMRDAGVAGVHVSMCVAAAAKFEIERMHLCTVWVHARAHVSRWRSKVQRLAGRLCVRANSVPLRLT